MKNFYNVNNISLLLFSSVLYLSIVIYGGGHFEGLLFTNPDGYSLYSEIIQFDLPYLLSIGANKGVYLFYYFPVKFFGPYGALMANLTLLFVVAVILHGKNENYITSALCIFPFFIVGMLVPSKDFLAFAIFALYVSFYSEGSLLKTLFVSVLMIFIRDGFGIMLLLCSFYCLDIVRKIIVNHFYKLVCALLFLVYFSQFFLKFALLTLLGEKRTTVIYSVSPFQETGSIAIDFVVKIVAYLFNMSTRIPFFNDSVFSIVQLSLLVSGVFFLYLMISTTMNMNIVIRNDKQIPILFLFISLFFLFLIVPYVQVRYFLPCAYILFYLFRKNHLDFQPILLAFQIVLCASVTTLYEIFDRFPSLIEHTAVNIFNL